MKIKKKVRSLSMVHPRLKNEFGINPPANDYNRSKEIINE
jgi:hypothetical protein